MTDPIFLIVDLFCGFGGTTTGFTDARIEGDKIAMVIACVNHDPKAIKSHWLNHPEVKHFEEDIRTLDLTELAMHVKTLQDKYPNAKLILWASLECTNFSKAKGGQPRNADSRTLAEHLFRYQKVLNPDYIQIENVVEFMSWGPLDANGKPLSRKNGQDWMKWRNDMCSLGGYYDEWKEMNSANFGAYTSRNRLFGVFTKPHLPVIWPQHTHSKIASPNGLIEGLKKWKAVKEVLNFSDEGESIFTRKKPLSDKTMERIYAGLIKYIANGDTSFISKYFSGKPEGKNITVERPAGTVTTAGNQSLVSAKFIVQRNTGNPDSKVIGIDQPARTITATGGNQELVQASFISNYKSGHPESKNNSVENPLGALTTVPTQALIQPEFLVASNGGTPSSKVFSTEDPCRTITTADNKALVQTEFLLQTYAANSKSHNTFPVDKPARTVTTRDSTQLVQPICMLKYDSTDKTGKHYPPSLENPSPVIIAQARLGLISGEFMYNYYGNSFTSSLEEPSPVVTTADNKALVQPQYFINREFKSITQSSVEEPAGALTTVPKMSLVGAHPFILNPSHGGHNTTTDAPCPVIIARQDKAPLYLVQVQNGSVAIAVFQDDSEITVKIKQFMAVFGLVDIKMRMLRVTELLKIQGFPEDYQMVGNQSDHKKFIGNSVVPNVVKAWCEAMAVKIIQTMKKEVA